MRMTPLLAFAGLLLAAPAFAQTAPARLPTISVMGAGEAQLKPDFARIFVSVETEADTVAQATSANAAGSERVLARIESLGVRKDDIRTANFQVLRSPVEIDRNGKVVRDKIRFTATHRLEITTRDLAGVGRLAGEILASGDMTFQSVSFGLDRQDEGGDKAREAAVRDARRQAEVYAKAAGVALGRVIEIRDGSAQAYEQTVEPRLRMAMAKGGAEEVPIVPPATIRYNASVQMVWQLAEP